MHLPAARNDQPPFLPLLMYPQAAIWLDGYFRGKLLFLLPCFLITNNPADHDEPSQPSSLYIPLSRLPISYSLWEYQLPGALNHFLE